MDASAAHRVDLAHGHAAAHLPLPALRQPEQRRLTVPLERTRLHLHGRERVNQQVILQVATIVDRRALPLLHVPRGGESAPVTSDLLRVGGAIGKAPRLTLVEFVVPPNLKAANRANERGVPAIGDAAVRVLLALVVVKGPVAMLAVLALGDAARVMAAKAESPRVGRRGCRGFRRGVRVAHRHREAVRTPVVVVLVRGRRVSARSLADDRLRAGGGTGGLLRAVYVDRQLAAVRPKPTRRPTDDIGTPLRRSSRAVDAGRRTGTVQHLPSELPPAVVDD